MMKKQVTKAELVRAQLVFAHRTLAPLASSGVATEWQQDLAGIAGAFLSGWSPWSKVLFDADGGWVRRADVDPANREAKDSLEWALSRIEAEAIVDGTWVGLGLERRRAYTEAYSLRSGVEMASARLVTLVQLFELAEATGGLTEAQRQVRLEVLREAHRASRAVREGNRGELSRLTNKVNRDAREALREELGLDPDEEFALIARNLGWDPAEAAGKLPANRGSKPRGKANRPAAKNRPRKPVTA